MQRLRLNFAAGRVTTALLLTWLISACGDDTPEAPPPPDIKVVEVIVRDTEITQDFVGQTFGSTDIPIRARVEGELLSRDFLEGRSVKQGQLLYTIDPAPFRTKVVEAEGGSPSHALPWPRRKPTSPV